MNKDKMQELTDLLIKSLDQSWEKTANVNEENRKEIFFKHMENKLSYMNTKDLSKISLSMKRNLLNELKEGLDALSAQLTDKQIVLSAQRIDKPFNYIIGYLYEDVSGNEHIQPYKSHNGAIFNGTIEDAKDSLADVMCAFQEEDWKIFVVSEYEEFKATITRIDNIYCFRKSKKSHITDEGRCSACGISQRDVLEYSESHHASIL